MISARVIVAGRYSDLWSQFSMSNIWSKAGFGAAYLHLDVDKSYPSHGGAERWRGFSLRGLGSGGDNRTNDNLHRETRKS